MTLCAYCLTHIVPSGRSDYLWRHADTGFLRCDHTEAVVFATPETEPETAA